MVNDDGCPTCGSKNFGILEITSNTDDVGISKNQCYNCQKFWFS